MGERALAGSERSIAGTSGRSVDEREERAAGGVLAGGDRVAVHAGGRVRERTALGAGEEEEAAAREIAAATKAAAEGERPRSRRTSRTRRWSEIY